MWVRLPDLAAVYLQIKLFDKVSVLYEGRQIFFGPASEAKEYFIDLGFEPKPRQTTADFLTSVTSPAERRIRKDFVGRIPATPDDFFVVWQKSQQFKHLQDDIDKFNESNPIGGPSLEEFRNARRSLQEKSQYGDVDPIQVLWWLILKHIQTLSIALHPVAPVSD